MDRRTFVKGSAAVVGASTLPGRVYAQAAAPAKLRFGYAITMSGPLGPGAESTTLSQYKLWAKRTNDAGGIMLKKFNKKVPVELVEYDDQGKPDELLKLTERLIQQDKVDMILSPYATHMNLASAPVINKNGYPVILSTSASAKLYEMAPSMPFAFWNLVQPNEATQPISALIAGLKKEGKIKGRVATIHPTVQLGVELHSAFLEAAKKDGLEIVYNKSYPFGSSDLQPVIREAMASNPDAFIAFSYPPDTFMITEQAQIVGFNPQIMYLAIGTPFPGFKAKFGNKVNGILLYGGLDTGAPGLEDYYKAHRAVLNRESEAGAVSVYAVLEVTQQAIEQVGEIDRKKIRDAIANGTFKTIWGEIKYKNQLHVDPWAVGQWQNGEVVGLYPANKPGARKLQFPKPAWS
ncbi:MAG TPA: ABC transporter substrate-binding protein [Pseudolabrys sp.]|jgi:branched-chain amino acid transport system substrate-binding protein|nr:ABC transporter substrate-binding protein [Pseudolabrys sp.]